MTSTDWMMFAAMLASPVIAVQVTQVLDRRRERRQRRYNLLHTLMATRATRLSPLHVQALNSIDMEFQPRKLWGSIKIHTKLDNAVLKAWRAYSDQLGQHFDKDDVNESRNWTLKRREECFVDLLYELSQRLGYDFDKPFLRTSIYSPVAHGEMETENNILRKGLADVFSGQKPLPMTLVSFPALEAILAAAKKQADQAKAETSTPNDIRQERVPGL